MIKGEQKLIQQLNSVMNVSAEALMAGAEKLRDRAKENAPVKTGFLRDSIEAVKTDKGAEVVVNANYGIYVEFGSSKWEGHPFLRPAVDTNQAEIVKAVSNQVTKEVKSKI
jgi:HK97 gp10 family phage protein